MLVEDGFWLTRDWRRTGGSAGWNTEGAAVLALSRHTRALLSWWLPLPLMALGKPLEYFGVVIKG